jgi:hypothetical protein
LKQNCVDEPKERTDMTSLVGYADAGARNTGKVNSRTPLAGEFTVPKGTAMNYR